MRERIAEMSATLFAWCRARTSTLADAEDLSQEILLALLESVPRLREEGAFYGFMWSVADRVYAKWLRKRRRNRETALTDRAVEEDHAFAALDEASDIALLRRELALLNRRCREATVLYYLDGLSCAEIAKRLSISESMVKYLLFKARKTLKEGINMDRQPGTLSYRPREFDACYVGTGPNAFWNLMKRLISQNILAACSLTPLTPEQISVEIGVPLPYLDGEIAELLERRMLLREGGKVRAGILLVSADCIRETADKNAALYRQIADRLSAFLDERLDAFRAIGFRGCDFSEMTLRWQLATLVFRQAQGYTGDRPEIPMPETAWGDRAFLFLREKADVHCANVAFSAMTSRRDDQLLFYDYMGNPPGNHHDLWSRPQSIDLLCEIVRGAMPESGYDRESAEELVRRGFLRRDGERLLPTMPVFTQAQFDAAMALAAAFVQEKLANMLWALDDMAERVLREHSPKYLHAQIPGVVQACRITHAVEAPLARLTDSGALSAGWLPGELPGMQIILKN